jgi:mono/diheme cytochrome c family protein
VSLRFSFAALAFNSLAIVLSQVACPGTASASNAATPAQIERGRYLALAGNCASCHTTADGKPFAGGVVFETSFGKIYSTNITPDAQAGIGNWTEQQFRQALREGVRTNGEHLYPAFPYTSFTKITDDDAGALFAYLKSVPAVSAKAPENDMSWPYSMRSLMSVWNALYFDAGPYRPDAGKSKEWNRGAYLVESLAHCSACHSPRNSLGAEESDMALTGGAYTDHVTADMKRAWSAPNLTSASNGLGSWTVDDLAAYLKTGKNAYAITFGPMNEVVMNSTRHLADADIHAMATYLKSLPPNEGNLQSPAKNDVITAGATVYDVQCGTCHLPTGLGAPDSGPKLAGSPVVQASDPASLINVILYGPQLPDPAPPTGEWQHMEAFGEKLSDEEIAALASYLRNAWNNKGGEVTAAQVARQR